MPTPIFICGAECGIAVTGTASAGTEHWSGVGGTPTVATSGPSPMRSTRALRFNSSAGQTTLVHTFASAIASPATLVARFYIYFTTLPNFKDGLFVDNNTGFGCYFVASDSTLRAGTAAADAGSGKVITTGVWYRVDMKVVLNTTRTVDIQVDGVAQTQYSVAGAATTSASIQVGDSASPVTADYYLDDILVSGTSGNYPIGAGTVVGLYPNGDKTNSAANPTDGNGGHLYSATTDFGKGSGGGTALGAQNVESTSWQSLQNPLTTTVQTNFIADALGSSTEHLVWTHDATPSTVASVNGLMLVATSHSASATANNQSMHVTDSAGGNALTAWNLLDLSESTITVPVATFATKPGGGAWDKSSVDGCLIRWGDSSDVNPDAFLDGVCLEVDYVASTGTTVNPTTASATATGTNPVAANQPQVAGSSATASANNPVAAVSPQPAFASATATASGPVESVAPQPQVASATASASNPAVAIQPQVTNAAATATASNPTVTAIVYDPPDLQVTIVGSTATLDWSASPSNVATYDVFRRTPSTGAAFTPGTDTPIVTGITTLTYDDTSLAAADYDWQVFGEIFTPLNLPNLVAWYDASDTSSITSSGGAVSQWNDQSGNGFHLTQSTATAKPTTGTRTINGLNVLDFDGGDHLNISGVTARTGTIGLWWVVVVADSYTGYPRLGWSCAPTSGSDFNSVTGIVPYEANQDSGGARGVQYASPGENLTTTHGVATGVAHIAVVTRNGTGGAIYINNNSPNTTSSFNSGAFAITRWAAGYSVSGGSDFMNGAIGEMGWAETTTDPTVALIRYLNAKWAVY